jgi:hypothetical protein
LAATGVIHQVDELTIARVAKEWSAQALAERCRHCSGARSRSSTMKRDRPARLGVVSETVANQESQVVEKQQRDFAPSACAGRVAHHPGDAAVLPGAARLLSA